METRNHLRNRKCLGTGKGISKSAYDSFYAPSLEEVITRVPPERSGLQNADLDSKLKVF